MRELTKDRMEVEESSKKSDYELDKEEITKEKKLICQRFKIDKIKCKNIASGLYKTIPVCTDCYERIVEKNRNEYYKVKLWKNRQSKCSKCSKPILMTGDRRTTMCRDCLDKNRTKNLK